MQARKWKIVDGQGADVMTAASIEAAARRERRSPRQVAEREAKLLVNVDAGDSPVFAVLEDAADEPLQPK